MDNVRVRYSGNNDSKGYAKGIDFRINGEFVSGFESWLNLSFLDTKEKIYGVQHKDVTGQPVDYVPRPTSRIFAGSLYFQDYFGPPGENLVQRNAVRFKTYQRVDIGFSYQLWDEINRDEKPHNLFKFTRKTWISLEVFNLMDVQNVASVNWVKDFNNIYYFFPVNLTSRRFNLKLRMDL